MIMSKKVMIALAVIALVAMIVPSAYAAITDAQKQKVDDLQKQMLELKKEMVETYVDAGEITQEQADVMIERMESMEKYRSENGITPGFGKGGRRGSGGCGGAGFGGCFQGGNTPQLNTSNQVVY